MKWPRYGLAALGMMLFASAGGAVVYSNGGGPITAIAGAIVDLGNWATTTTGWSGSGAPGTMAAWGIATYNKLNSIASSLGGTLATSRTWTLSSGTDSVTTTLGAGSVVIGKVGIDQTTEGTTNGVVTLCNSGSSYTACTTANPLGMDVGTGSNLYGGVTAPLAGQTGAVWIGNVGQYNGSSTPWYVQANAGMLGYYTDGSTFTSSASGELVIAGNNGGATQSWSMSPNGSGYMNLKQVNGTNISLGQYAVGSSIPVALATGQVPVDPCYANQKFTNDYEGTTSSTSGTQIILAPATGKKAYICSLVWSATANTQIQLIEGTGSSTCSGGTIAAVFGSADGSTITQSHGMALAAYGAYTYGNGSATIAVNATAAQNTCVVFTTTNSPQVNVHVTYAVN